ncbi:9702_t:CDS:2, partial [Scutellospora calospora]
MDSIYSDEMNEKEKILLKKIDWRIVPLMFLLYLLSFLDRVNIGNAKLAHLERDLGLVGNDYNWSLGIFFIGYVLFEIPSNLILFKVRPSIWIPSTMVAWGITMSLMAFVNSYSTLMITRFFLGVFEAGLVPGMVYYITLWYKRYEQSFRIGTILSGASIAGAFSGLLAYAIVNFANENSKLKGWQLVFLIDGLVTVIVAFVAYFCVEDYPEEAEWLSNEERELAISRLRKDIDDIDDIKIRSHSFEKVYVLECLKDWCNVGVAMMLSSGNAGGIIAAQIYRSKDYPHYVPGHIISSGFLLASICLCVIQYGALVRLNEMKRKKRNQIKSSGDEKI